MTSAPATVPPAERISMDEVVHKLVELHRNGKEKNLGAFDALMPLLMDPKVSFQTRSRVITIARRYDHTDGGYKRFLEAVPDLVDTLRTSQDFAFFVGDYSDIWCIAPPQLGRKNGRKHQMEVVKRVASHPRFYRGFALRSSAFELLARELASDKDLTEVFFEAFDTVDFPERDLFVQFMLDGFLGKHESYGRADSGVLEVVGAWANRYHGFTGTSDLSIKLIESLPVEVLRAPREGYAWVHPDMVERYKVSKDDVTKVSEWNSGYFNALSDRIEELYYLDSLEEAHRLLVDHILHPQTQLVVSSEFYRLMASFPSLMKLHSDRLPEIIADVPTHNVAIALDDALSETHDTNRLALWENLMGRDDLTPNMIHSLCINTPRTNSTGYMDEHGDEVTALVLDFINSDRMNVGFFKAFLDASSTIRIATAGWFEDTFGFRYTTDLDNTDTPFSLSPIVSFLPIW